MTTGPGTTWLMPVLLPNQVVHGVSEKAASFQVKCLSENNISGKVKGYVQYLLEVKGETSYLTV